MKQSIQNLVVVVSCVFGLVACQPPAVSCDLSAPQCADSSMKCFPSGTGMTGVCAEPGSVATGGTCKNVLAEVPDCVANNVCLNVGDSTATTKKCIAMCNPDGGAPQCSSGSCTHANGGNFSYCY